MSVDTAYAQRCSTPFHIVNLACCKMQLKGKLCIRVSTMTPEKVTVSNVQEVRICDIKRYVYAR